MDRLFCSKLKNIFEYTKMTNKLLKISLQKSSEMPNKNRDHDNHVDSQMSVYLPWYQGMLHYNHV